MGECVSCVSIKSEEGCPMNNIETETEGELADRFTWLERTLLCSLAAVFLVIAGLAFLIAWAFAPECECPR